MKTKIIFGLIFTGFSIAIFAQDKGDIEIGGNLGLNVSNVTNLSASENADSKISFNIGSSAEYYFSESWGLKAKIIYDRKGWSNGFEETDSGRIDTDFTLSYITVPLMANWHFGRTDNWYLNFGPYAGFLLSAESTERGTDFTEATNSTDFGIAFGIGVKIPLNKETKIYFEYDAQSGLSDISKNNSGDAIRNGRSSLNVGLLFNL